MALTSTVPETHPARDLGRLTWILVVAALAAAIAFAVVVVRQDDVTPVVERSTVESPAIPEGSPDAIERRALAEEAFSPTAEPFVDRGSIAALDHATATSPAAAGFDRSTQPFVDRGSITAIDHEAATAGDDADG